MGFFKSTGGFLNDLLGVTDTSQASYRSSVKLWNMQNEYNHPKNQIARMAEAGIDVNPMTYAVGNGSMSTTASSPAQPQFSGAGINPVATAMQVMSGLKGLERQDAEIENTRALTNQINMLTPQKLVKLENEIGVMIHNLKYAEKNGLPVGQAETLDKFKAELLQRLISIFGPKEPEPPTQGGHDPNKPSLGSNANGDNKPIKWFPW